MNKDMFFWWWLS